MDCLHRVLKKYPWNPICGFEENKNGGYKNGNMVDWPQLEVGVCITFITQPEGVLGAVIVEGAAGGYGCSWEKAAGMSIGGEWEGTWWAGGYWEEACRVGGWGVGGGVVV